jgi:hypothetical protein
MTALQSLQAFEIQAADVTVWAIKRSGGHGGAQPVYTARWIAVDAELTIALKEAVQSARAGIAEVAAYGLLAHDNDGASALSISADETNAPLVLNACSDPTPQRKVKSLREIANSDFYVVKLVIGADAILAIRKTNSSWASNAGKGLFSAVFEDNVLTLDERPRFTLSNTIDFFIIGTEVLVLNKANFESVLSYRQAHIEDFGLLQNEPEFILAFSVIEPLVNYIGTNKLQLRRASAIRTKGYYKDPVFMERLRNQAAALHLNIGFDAAGRIVPTPETCRDIMQALLDHRLTSLLTEEIYDVDDAQAVGAPAI